MTRSDDDGGISVVGSHVRIGEEVTMDDWEGIHNVWLVPIWKRCEVTMMIMMIMRFR